MTETRFFGFICHLPMPQQRCAEGLKTWFLWVLLRLFQYLPNSSSRLTRSEAEGLATTPLRFVVCYKQKVTGIPQRTQGAQRKK